MCDIIQVSAICENKVFNAYTVPSHALHMGVTDVTGFTVHDGNLFRHGVWMPTIPLLDALTGFIDYLCTFRHPILLVAHNARCFDALVLTRVLRQFVLQQQRFQQVVCGFLDTLKLSKNVFPDLTRYSQEYLVSHFLRKTYDAHNAEEDARMLQELFYTWNCSKTDISRCIDSLSKF